MSCTWVPCFQVRCELHLWLSAWWSVRWSLLQMLPPNLLSLLRQISRYVIDNTVHSAVWCTVLHYLYLSVCNTLVWLSESHLVGMFNPFPSRDAIWHHTFNSVFHMLQFWGAGKGSSPKKCRIFCNSMVILVCQQHTTGWRHILGYYWT
jgi:hypothetical protein